jgi:hypothetical protein
MHRTCLPVARLFGPLEPEHGPKSLPRVSKSEACSGGPSPKSTAQDDKFYKVQGAITPQPLFEPSNIERC